MERLLQSKHKGGRTTGRAGGPQIPYFLPGARFAVRFQGPPLCGLALPRMKFHISKSSLGSGLDFGLQAEPIPIFSLV